LIKFRSLFSLTPNRIHGFLHRIKLFDETPFVQKSYPIPFAYRNQVQEEIDKMVKAGIIRKQKTAYINPLLVVKKRRCRAPMFGCQTLK
jgi:hypothetical protein